MAFTGARSFFDFAHSSVALELADGKTRKTLQVSPVMLSYWSEYFATRYRPGSEWEPDTLHVEDVDTAELVLRLCYNPRDASLWEGKDWDCLMTALKTCDLLQLRPGVIGIVLDRVIELLKKKDFDYGPNPFEIISTLRDTSIADCEEFLTMLADLFPLIIGPMKSRADGGESEFELPRDQIGHWLSRTPENLRADCLWYFVGKANGKITYRMDALKMIAQDLLDMKEEAHAKPYLQRILVKRRIHTDSSSDSDRDEIMSQLANINGDEIKGSFVLRARDALALRLKGGIAPDKAVKRKRDKTD